MGIIKKIPGVKLATGLLSDVMGTNKAAAKPAAAAPKAEEAVKPPATTSAVTAETEAEKQKKALLAINAGADQTATLGATSPATVTRRYLLGL